MKIIEVTPKHTSALRKQCLHCKRVAKVKDRVLYKASAGYGYPAWHIHVKCLATILKDEPEFMDKDAVAREFEQYRQFLIKHYEAE